MTWTVDPAKGPTVAFHTTMKVGDTPEDLLRLASVDCAGMTPEGPPIVCAAHSGRPPEP